MKPVDANERAAQVFLRIADMMAYRDESQFKVRAYYRAALTLTGLQEPLVDIAARGDLQNLPGVGEAIAGKIEEILQKGTCDLHERLKGEVAPEIQELLEWPGLTPRLVRLLEIEFSVQNVEGLRALVESGGLADLEGLSLRVEEAAQILRAVAFAPESLSASPPGFDPFADEDAETSPAPDPFADEDEA